MPRIGVYRSLLVLIGIYSNLLDPINKKEIVFLFFLIRFHILFLRRKHRATLKRVKGFCSSADFHLECCIFSETVGNSTSRRTKQNFVVDFFQNEPIGRINEYTYQSAVAS